MEGIFSGFGRFWLNASTLSLTADLNLGPPGTATIIVEFTNGKSGTYHILVNLRTDRGYPEIVLVVLECTGRSLEGKASIVCRRLDLVHHPDGQ